MQLDKIIAAQPKRVRLSVESLTSMSKEAARALVFAAQKLVLDENIILAGPNAQVKATLQAVGAWEELNVLELAGTIGD